MKKGMLKCPVCGRFTSTTAHHGEPPGEWDRYVAHGPGPQGQMFCPNSRALVLSK